MSHKLYYFDARGLNEPLRMIFAVGGVEYEDVRIPMESLPPKIPAEIKQKLTWTQVPMVEFEGRKLCQSLAMQRYFAKQFNLVGSNDFEAAQIDEYVDCAKEILTLWVSAFIENDPDKLGQLKKENREKSEEKYLKKLNEIVEANGGKRLVGKNLSWADIWLAHVINNIEIVVGVKLADNFTGLKSLYDTVFSVPQIKEWVEKRPKSKF